MKFQCCSIQRGQMGALMLVLYPSNTYPSLDQLFHVLNLMMTTGTSTLEWKDRKKLETAKLVALGSKVEFNCSQRSFSFC